MMLVWHVDKSNVSHLDIFEITKFTHYLSTIFGELTVHIGKVHCYLGMYLEYS